MEDREIGRINRWIERNKLSGQKKDKEMQEYKRTEKQATMKTEKQKEKKVGIQYYITAK